MTDTTAIPSNVSVGGGKIDGDHMDMDSLRELSVAEYDREYGAAQPKSAAKKLNGKTAAEIEDVDEIEETFEEPEEGEEEAAPKAAPGPEDEEEEPDLEEEGEDDEPAEDGEEGEDAGKKYLTAKTKEGKTYKVAKDAVVEVKIDGKREEMTVQELINQASGAVSVDRKHTELGRERKKLQVERQQFDEHVTVTNDNIATLQHLAENGTPEDFAQYYGLLLGKNPDEVLLGIVQRSIEYAEQFSRLSPREKQLYNENRKFKFEQELVKRERDRTAKQQTFHKERAEVEKALTGHGLSMGDFLAACEDVKQRITAGELTGQYSPMDIVGYAVTRQHDQKVTAAISVVDRSALKDKDFVTRVSKAIASAEDLSGEKFTTREAQTLVRKALEARKNGVRESLSKKADRARKSGKTNSQNAHSRKQENGTGGALTLRDHYDRLWGGD